MNEAIKAVVVSALVQLYSVSALEAAQPNPGGQKTKEEEEEEEDLSLVYAARGQQTVLQCWFQSC